MNRYHYILEDSKESWANSILFVLERSGHSFEVFHDTPSDLALSENVSIVAMVQIASSAQSLNQLKKRIRNATGSNPYLVGLSDARDTELCPKKADLFDLLHKGSLSPSEAMDLLFTIKSDIDLKINLNSWQLPISQAKLSLYQQAKQVRDLQITLSPKQGQVFKGLKTYMVSKPMFMISGDHCAAHQIDENHVAFYLIDVVGHGIASGVKSLGIARLLSPDNTEGIICKTDLKTGQTVLLEPHQVVQTLNSIYKMTDDNDTYFAGAYGYYNRTTREARVCVAGIPSLMVLSETGEARKIEANDVAIGLFEDHEYQTTCFTIEPKDRLFLFSDGLPEAMTPSYDLFGEDNVLKCIQSHSHSHTLKIFQEIICAVTHWCGRDTSEFEDDLSAFCLEFDSIESNGNELEEFAHLTPKSENTLSELTDQILCETKTLTHNPTVIIFKNDIANDQDIKALSHFCSTLNLNAVVYGRDSSAAQINKEQLSHAACVVFMEGTTTTDKLKCLLILEDNLAFGQLPLVLDLSLHETLEDVKYRINNLTDFYLRVAHRKDLAYWLKKVRSLSAKYIRLAKRNQKANQFLATFDQDLKKVASLQSVLLQKCRRSREAFDTHYIYRPGNLISGDFIGVFRLTKNIFSLVLIDTSGQGILSATQGWAIYRMLAGVGGQDLILKPNPLDKQSPILVLPAEVLTRLNDKTLENKEAGNPSFAVTYALFDEATGELTLSMAGSTPALICRDGKGDDEIQMNSPKLGLSGHPDYGNYCTKLTPGDRLLLATDGLFQSKSESLNSGSKQIFFKALKVRDSKKIEVFLKNLLKNHSDESQKDASAIILTFGKKVQAASSTASTEGSTEPSTAA